jgi:hypothetical protein
MSGVSDLLWLARNVGNTREVGGFVAGLTRTLGRFLSPSAGSLNGPIGPHRRWCWVQGDLDEVRTIRCFASSGSAKKRLTAVRTCARSPAGTPWPVILMGESCRIFSNPGQRGALAHYEQSPDTRERTKRPYYVTYLLTIGTRMI